MNEKEIFLQLGLKDYKLIGMGMFGKVYRAMDENGRTVCVKIIPQQNFKKEEYLTLEKLANKKNPNIISIYYKKEIDNFVILVMEYVDGGELKTYVDKHKDIKQVEIFNMIYQICLIFIIFSNFFSIRCLCYS
jgi:serine/threonine-protein kinase